MGADAADAARLHTTTISTSISSQHQDEDTTSHIARAGEATSDTTTRVRSCAEWLQNAEVATSANSDGGTGRVFGFNTSVDAPWPRRGEAPTKGIAA
jgi:hypothetical protein